MADAIFSRQLRKVRISKGKTQHELASALDLNDKTISSYERAVREPDLGTLRKLALSLNVSLDILVGIKPESEEDIDVITKLLNQMQPQVVQNIRNLLENIHQAGSLNDKNTYSEGQSSEKGVV